MSPTYEQRETAWREWMTTHRRPQLMLIGYEHQCGALTHLNIAPGNNYCSGCRHEIRHPADECTPIYREPTYKPWDPQPQPTGPDSLIDYVIGSTHHDAVTRCRQLDINPRKALAVTDAPEKLRGTRGKRLLRHYDTTSSWAVSDAWSTIDREAQLREATWIDWP